MLFMSCLERLDREWLEAKASYMQFNGAFMFRLVFLKHADDPHWLFSP